MQLHYFQRYAEKENVATANTMLLLSRLYTYSPNKFFQFLKSEYFGNTFEPEIVFTLQEKSVDSIPDATIKQDSFKLVIETKLTDWFQSDQLMRHLNSFSDEKNKVIITLAPEPMSETKLKEFNAQLKTYNSSQSIPVQHINTTFELLATAVEDVLDDRDYEMKDILDDFLDYCYHDHLIPNYDSWKYMRMQLAGTTLDYNISNNIYYDNAERGFRAHDYLGLYKNKSIRAIGKVCARIRAVEENGKLIYKADFGEATDERKKQIQKAIDDAEKEFGYDLRTIEHIYFFVDKFYETDFKKISPRGSMGSRIFNLPEVLGSENIPSVEKIAEELRECEWV